MFGEGITPEVAGDSLLALSLLLAAAGGAQAAFSPVTASALGTSTNQEVARASNGSLAREGWHDGASKKAGAIS